MITRINTIIKREKKLYPHKSGFTLLYKRILYVLKQRINRFYVRISKNSTFTSVDEMFMCSLFPEKVLSIIINEINPSSVLDVGCGTGKSLEFFIKHNIEAIGFENSDTAIAASSVSNSILKFNLNKEVNLNRKFDLVWCFEVIEHIHPDFEQKFLKTLTNHSNLIILSAARPGQGGFGHFNEQDPEYWIDKFSNIGYKYDAFFSKKLRSTLETHSENLLCFRK